MRNWISTLSNTHLAALKNVAFRMGARKTVILKNYYFAASV